MTYLKELTMDGYYTQDRLLEIRKQIDSLHLSYLELEESPQKLQQRNKLEEYIREFLCLAPHNQKFYFRETADVLHRSASVKKDFSGYRAALGWNAIGMYAANLLNQPWRKEYKQIQLYSGFYKHQIDANLVGAEIIFEIMGYKRNGDGILVLDEPICPDQVINMSQDSLIAYVECQILKAIWEEVSLSFKASWLEVLEFRESHLCSLKQSVQALTYRFHERQFQQHTRSYSQGTDPFIVNSRLLGNAHPSAALSAHSFPPLQHSHASVSSTPCIYGTNNYYHNTCPTYATIGPQHYAYQNIAKPVYYPANYFPNGYIVPPPPPPYVCPTAQLIELESQGSHHYDTVDDVGHARSETFSTKNSLKNSSDKEEVDPDTIDNWDFVYRDLESQGYSKDLGERGDLLTFPSDGKKLKGVAKEARKVKYNNVEEGINNLNLNDKASKTNESIPKFKDREREQHVYEVLKSTNEKEGVLQKQAVNGYIKNTNTLPSVEKSTALTNTVIENSRPSNSKTLDVRKQKQNQTSDRISPKIRDQNTKEMLKNDLNKWQCTTCTYLNELSSKICEMCGKSKVKVQDVMEIGGSQCSKCTLVNPKDHRICSACSSSLKDSPTYI